MGRSITNGPNLRLPQQKEAVPQELLEADPQELSYPAQVTGSHLFVPSGPKWSFAQLFPRLSHLTPKQGK